MPRLFALALLLAGPAMADTYLYVSLAGENRIAVYRQDPRDGSLTPTGSVAVDGAPGALTADPERRLLFASLRSTRSLASFRVDPATGIPTLLSTVPNSSDAAFVGLDGSRRYLLSAYYAAGRVMVHAIRPDGVLEVTPRADVATDRNAHSTLPTPDNRFVVVPHTGPNAIHQFRFELGTGALSANDPARVSPSGNAGPRHLRFHPTRPFAYTSDEQGSSASVWA